MVPARASQGRLERSGDRGKNLPLQASPFAREPVVGDGAGVRAGDVDVAAVAADIRRRDAADSGREASPLVEADGSVTLDTSELTVDEVVEAIVALLR